MNVTTDQVLSASNAAVQMLLGIANAQFAAFERLSALNVNAAKAAFEAGVRQSKSLLGAKDVQQLASLNLAAPNLESAIAYSRSVYELATQTQSEITQLIESQAAAFTHDMVEFLDQVSRTAPAGSDVAFAAVKSAFAAANSARESIVTFTKQATQMAEANVRAANNGAREVKTKAA